MDGLSIRIAINPNVSRFKEHPPTTPRWSESVRAIVSSCRHVLMVRIADCNGSSKQKWVIARGSTTVKLAGTNFCFDAGSNPGNGVKAKIYTVSHFHLVRPVGLELMRECYAGLAAQTWYFTDDNRIAVQGKGQCLDLTGMSSSLHPPVSLPIQPCPPHRWCS
jgi:hypothetical protein